MTDIVRSWPDDVVRLDSTAAPHGWIQWKGTKVCMDVHCDCGAQSHVDGEFAYVIQCGACGKEWAVSSTVRLYALAEDCEDAPDAIPAEAER